ncbi:MAG: Polysaccharide deacetylase [uncultured bacterium]|nr:MAG: Polysaccharide deacetylase [uncultured bacterium]
MSSLLLSVDLEDVRDWVKDGDRYREGVPENTRLYLDRFKRWGVKATFFVVGRVARRYPQLIREIVAAGHELACHGDMHLQLDKLSPQQFREDMEANLLALREAGGTGIYGFRAPTFSLTERTAWAHEILADLGFTYSSSVLPAKSPLYGWPTFGQDARKVTKTLWELPITLHGLPGLTVPIAGGVYFRVLPFFLTRWAIGRKIGRGQPVGTYFHPYDIDTGQERFMHPDLGEKKHLNMLMYIGRAKVLSRLAALHTSFPFTTYGEYVNCLQASSS